VDELVVSLALLAGLMPQTPTGPILVEPGSAVPTLTAALRLAKPGDTILVLSGNYGEPRIVVAVPVTILGRGSPTFDGQGTHEILTVTADGVTIRGLTLRNVGHSYTEDRAAIRLEGVRGCTVSGNRIAEAFFGIYAARSSDCVITDNILEGRGGAQSTSGNAIHLFQSDGFTVARNRIHGHRDGIYLEFSPRARIFDNESAANLRYGLHFMYSDTCDYRGNRFVHNGAGVAVMYSRAVTMIGNRFADNWGPASYGLLLKEIKDSRVERNVLSGNSTGIYAEGSDRIVIAGNQFLGNGWAVRLMADATDNSFRRNRFEGNSFDVATNGSNGSSSSFAENFWDGYAGYDLDRDGYGDVPYRPVRLFSVLVEQSEPALILLRSFFLDLLDLAERVVPVITPERLVDARPLMRWSAS
jgi:nitrous oxidase accessory protein